MKVSKILVPLDGSPLAETAVRPALDLASAFGAGIRLPGVAGRINPQAVAQTRPSTSPA